MLFYTILRDKVAFFSKTTFYNYVKRLQLQRAKPEKMKSNVGIRADAPLRILHMDVTIYKPLDNTRVYLYFLVDNYSRCILNWKASLQYSANITLQNIKEAYEKYDLGIIMPRIDLICDGGSENKGGVDVFVNQNDNNLNKLIAQTDIIFSNSMVEAVNKRIKYDFLFTEKLYDIEQVNKYLNFAVDQYNNKPHSALYGLTPIEACKGQIPDKTMFKPAMLHAAKARKDINLNQNCLNCVDIEPQSIK